MSDFIPISSNTSVTKNTEELPVVSATSRKILSRFTSAEAGSITMAGSTSSREILVAQQAQEDLPESEVWEQYKLVKAQFYNVLRMLADS